MKLDIEHVFFECLDMLIQGNLDGIVKIIYNSTGFPITILNSGFSILASAPKEPIGDKYWDAALRDGGTPHDLIKSLEDQKITEYCYANPDGVILNFGDITYPRAMGILKTPKSTLGYLSIYITNNQYEEEGVLRLARMLIKIITFFLLYNKKFLKVHSLEADVLAEKLFENQITSLEELHRWEVFSGLSLTPQYIVLAIYDTEELKGMLDYFNTQLFRIYPFMLCATVNGIRYYLIYNFPSQKEWEKIKPEFTRRVKRFHFYLGISMIFQNILRLPTYMKQAQETLAICMSRKNNSSYMDFQEAQYEIILSKITNGMDEISYIHKHFLTLKEYDRTYGTDYENTLITFLNCNCDTAKTTQILFIHRNTTQYRLKKIEEICGFSFSDTKLCQSMMLSAWILNNKK